MARRIAFDLASIALFGLLSSPSSLASTDAGGEIWRTSDAPAGGRHRFHHEIAPGSAHVFDPVGLDAVLRAAPLRAIDNVGGIALFLPRPDGELVEFRVVERPTLSAALQAVRPHLRTYVGTRIDDPSVQVRLTRWPEGLQARVDGVDGWTIETPSFGARDEALVRSNADVSAAAGFLCGTEQTPRESLGSFRTMDFAKVGSELRVYELAVSAPGEFTQFHGSVANAEGQIASLINFANGVFERDLAVRLEIVDFNVYSDPATDPFSSGTVMSSTLLSENHNALVSKLGSSGFELGHVVGRLGTAGWEGLAQVAVQCNSQGKGWGGTLAGSPNASSLLEGILHEGGHQLGAFHSFNGTTDRCGGNRSPSWAYEIASGVSIMSYAGTCGAENVTSPRMQMYDAGALEAIGNAVLGSPSCGGVVPTGNNPPVADAGPNYVIPRETAFVLDGSGSSDVDPDPLTYSWEQHDLGPASPPYGPAAGPLLRNFAPVSASLRSVPSYNSYVLAGFSPWEFLPTVDRDLTFRLVVRDNHAGTGGTAWDTTVLTVAGDPFRVSSPNGGESLPAGSPFAVTWQPGGGAVAPNVRILVSTDRGVTWTEVESSTANDGSHTVDMPCQVSTEARVRIEPVGNIFFDISDVNFTVTADQVPAVLTCPGPFAVAATGPDGISKDDPSLTAWIATASAVDNCDPNPTVSFAAPPMIPIGVNVVAFTALDASNNLSVCTTELTVNEATAVPGLAGRTALLGIHPNPFNPSTSIRFHLRTAQAVKLEILDIRGRRIEVAQQGFLEAGPHEFLWTIDGASGVYIARLVTEDGVFHRRLALLK